MFLFLIIECLEEIREFVLIVFEKGDVVCLLIFEEGEIYFMYIVDFNIVEIVLECGEEVVEDVFVFMVFIKIRMIVLNGYIINLFVL